MKSLKLHTKHMESICGFGCRFGFVLKEHLLNSSKHSVPAVFRAFWNLMISVQLHAERPARIRKIAKRLLLSAAKQTTFVNDGSWKRHSLILITTRMVIAFAFCSFRI